MRSRIFVPVGSSSFINYRNSVCHETSHQPLAMVHIIISYTPGTSNFILSKSYFHNIDFLYIFLFLDFFKSWTILR